jgi:hypothetical protein
MPLTSEKAALVHSALVKAIDGANTGSVRVTLDALVNLIDDPIISTSYADCVTKLRPVNLSERARELEKWCDDVIGRIATVDCYPLKNEPKNTAFANVDMITLGKMGANTGLPKEHQPTERD